MEQMELGRVADDLFREFSINGTELARAVGEGKIGEAVAVLVEAVQSTIGQPLIYAKEYLITFLILGIGAALIKQLGVFFQDSQVQKIGFWVVYIFLAGQFLELYYNGEIVAQACLRKLIDFGNVFVPIFSGVLTLASGSVTGAGYITALLLIIYLIEQFLLNVMVPFIEGYMLLCLLGVLWQRERVEKLIDLIGKGIHLGFKGVIAATTGFGVLQSMILPYVDRAKVGAVKKMVDLIPGAGGLAGTTLEMVTGSAVLLKNGIGVIGILLLTLAAAAPLLKLGFFCLILRVSSAVFGLYGEKQMMWCADKMSTAEGYLWKIVFCGVVLFMLWIVLAVYTTNQRLMM